MLRKLSWVNWSGMNQIPRPLLVGGVLLIGVLLFFVIEEPHSVCKSQEVLFQESQAGNLYPKKQNESVRPPLYSRLITNCRQGNGPGSCFEFFGLLRKLLRDLNTIPQECSAHFGELGPVKRALVEGSQLMALLAWGDRPPERGASRFSWLEAADISLFCQLKDNVSRIYGDAMWESIRQGTHKKMPGEAPILVGGQCGNCETMKKASEVLSGDEIWVRSLFSVRCEQFR